MFVTVGTELPFNRLIRIIDEWAGNHRSHEVFAQIGRTDYRPSNISFTDFVEGPIFDERFVEADLVVSHAGMGTVLSALQHRQPLIVMPRRAALGEHRNDHQVATARWLSTLGQIQVAMDEAELLGRLVSRSAVVPERSIGPHADPSLIEAVRRAVDEVV